MTGGLTAECNFNAINPIDCGIASGRAPQDVDAGPGQETHMREVIAHLFRQIDPLQTTVLAHLHLTEAHLFPPNSVYISPNSVGQMFSANGKIQ